MIPITWYKDKFSTLRNAFAPTDNWRYEALRLVS